MCEVYTDRVLTGLQVAKLFVNSYPRLPDGIAILAAAAALHAPPLHHPVLRTGHQAVPSSNSGGATSGFGAGLRPQQQEVQQAGVQGLVPGLGSMQHPASIKDCGIGLLPADAGIAGAGGYGACGTGTKHFARSSSGGSGSGGGNIARRSTGSENAGGGQVLGITPSTGCGPSGTSALDTALVPGNLISESERQMLAQMLGLGDRM